MNAMKNLCGTTRLRGEGSKNESEIVEPIQTQVHAGHQPGLDYGSDGYDPGGCNVGVDPAAGGVQIEINGLIEAESDEASRICREDLNEVPGEVHGGWNGGAGCSLAMRPRRCGRRTCFPPVDRE